MAKDVELFASASAQLRCLKIGGLREAGSSHSTDLWLRAFRRYHQSYSLDKKTDLSSVEIASLARVLANDFLVVDASKPCVADSFLEIEKSLIQGKTHQSCGGRRPVSDIVDTLFTLYIGGFNGKRVRDGVDAPNKAISNDFPHLAKPDLDLISRTKATIARKVLGIED